MDLITKPFNDYQLIDHGDGKKLEKIGPYLLNRPSPQSIWPRKDINTKWNQTDANYFRSSSGGGHWEYQRQLPESWIIEIEQLKIKIKPTGFGHLGFFPEHIECWKLITDIIRQSKQTINVLNLFAYTGVSSLMLTGEGAKVSHVDASKGAITWANENRALNHMDNTPIRWILDDVVKFVERERRRRNTYQGIIIDPPSFGRGPKGQVWKLDDHLTTLMAYLIDLFKDAPLFFLMTTHSPQISVPGMHNYFHYFFDHLGGEIMCGHMLIESLNRLVLPSGIYGLWHADIS